MRDTHANRRNTKATRPSTYAREYDDGLSHEVEVLLALKQENEGLGQLAMPFEANGAKVLEANLLWRLLMGTRAVQVSCWSATASARWANVKTPTLPPGA